MNDVLEKTKVFEPEINYIENERYGFICSKKAYRIRLL